MCVLTERVNDVRDYDLALSEFKLSLYSTYWRACCHKQVCTLVRDYGSITGIRVDLNYPVHVGCEGIDNSNDDIMMLIKQIKSQVDRFVGYVVFREVSGVSGKKHYHCVLYFKGVRGIGMYYSEAGIQRVIIDSWLSVGGGSVSFRESLRFNQKSVMKQLGIANQHWFDYICKIKDKVSDGNKNILISRYDKDMVLPEENKIDVDKDRMYYYRQAFEAGLKKYTSTLVMQVSFYHPEVSITKGVMKAFGKVLHNHLLDEGKGGVAFIGGSVQLREEHFGWEGTEYRSTIMLSGGRYRTPCYRLRQVLHEIGEKVLSGVIVSIGLFHWIAHKYALENSVIKKGLEKFYLIPLLYDKVGKVIKEGVMMLTGIQRNKKN